MVVVATTMDASLATVDKPGGDEDDQRIGDEDDYKNLYGSTAYDQAEQALGAGAGEEAAQGDRHLDAARNSEKNDSGPAILLFFVRFGGIGWRKMVCVGGVLIFGVGAAFYLTRTLSSGYLYRDSLRAPA